MVNHYQSKTKTEIKFKKRFNKSSDENKIIENDSKEKFILSGNQLFILDTLNKSDINDINTNGSKNDSKLKFDEN